MRRLLLAAIGLALTAGLFGGPALAGKPQPLHLSDDNGAAPSLCPYAEGIGWSEDDTHYSTWTGYMEPGQTFSHAMYFCRPGGFNSGAYLVVEGRGDYAVAFDCLDRWDNPCVVTKTQENAKGQPERWNGCEKDPDGWVTVTVRLLSDRRIDTMISTGAVWDGQGPTWRCP